MDPYSTCSLILHCCCKLLSTAFVWILRFVWAVIWGLINQFIGAMIRRLVNWFLRLIRALTRVLVESFLFLLRNPRVIVDPVLEWLPDYGTGLLGVPLNYLFWCSNDTVCMAVMDRENRSLWSLFKVVTLVGLVIGVLYWFCWDKEPYYMLIFMRRKGKINTLYLLMGTVTFNDYMGKYMTVIVKAVVAALPDSVLAYSKRDKVFHFLEVTSQLYRKLLPIHPWISYLTSVYNNGSLVNETLGHMAVGVYLYIKAEEDWKFVGIWTKALKQLRNERGGKEDAKVPLEELQEDCCPICYDDFVNPTVLECKHPFCEKCLSEWFIKCGQTKKLCPLCRREVKWIDKVIYSDGSTMALRICF